jgi:hypothetical protein
VYFLHEGTSGSKIGHRPHNLTVDTSEMMFWWISKAGNVIEIAITTVAVARRKGYYVHGAGCQGTMSTLVSCLGIMLENLFTVSTACG